MIRNPLLIAFCLMMAPAVALAQALSPEQKTKTLESLQRTVVQRAFVPGIDFSKWPEHLAKQQSKLDAASDPNSFATSVNSALRDFGISHIRMLTPTAARSRATGQQIGYGIATAPDPRGLAISQVVPDSPAAKLLIEPGDIITAVEGMDNPKSLTVPLPDGTERDTCVMTILRPSTGKTRWCMLLKKAFSTDRSPELSWPAPDVAMIKLYSFTRGYDRKAIEDMMRKASKARAFILDLRNNGGGLVANLQHLLGLLTPDGTPTGTSVNRMMADRFKTEASGDSNDMVAVAKWNGPSMKTRKGNVEPFAGPIAVLINGRSGSASEITAAVLREKRNAILVGRKSAGAVLVSTFMRVDGGFEVQIPISDYVTPGGMRLEKNGLVPDVDAADPRRGDSDSGVAKALDALAPKKSAKAAKR
jgi:carboxyl-terminal processing protease